MNTIMIAKWFLVFGITLTSSIETREVESEVPFRATENNLSISSAAIEALKNTQKRLNEKVWQELESAWKQVAEPILRKSIDDENPQISVKLLSGRGSDTSYLHFHATGTGKNTDQKIVMEVFFGGKKGLEHRYDRWFKHVKMGEMFIQKIDFFGDRAAYSTLTEDGTEALYWQNGEHFIQVNKKSDVKAYAKRVHAEAEQQGFYSFPQQLLKAPVKETPVKETPVKEAPVKETPVKEAPVKETPVKEAPVKETPAAEVYDVPSLNANLSRVNFFEGGTEGIPFGQRKYIQKFSKLSSRFIYWDLGLVFPKHEKQVNFEIQEIWYRQDGSEIHQQVSNFYIKPEWTTHSYSYGFGWPQPGNWEPGTYRVDLFIAGRKIASETFEIIEDVKEELPPTAYDIPSLKANIASLKFFEGGFNGVPFGYREYSRTFSRSISKFIFLDLGLKHPKHERRMDFTILAIWYRPDEREMHRQSFNFNLDPEWTTSSHYLGYGWDEPGNWQLGTYRVDLFIDGQKIAKVTFKVTW